MPCKGQHGDDPISEWLFHVAAGNETPDQKEARWAREDRAQKGSWLDNLFGGQPEHEEEQEDRGWW